ncbi:MAG: GNAT family N-acetyltransferase [Clostridia bacterium]|nr:GNAT family N-acetyltransferase [Clostridia bacterium]
MIRKTEHKDKAEYIEMAKNFYNSPAVLSPIPDSHFENTFEEFIKRNTYAEAFIFEYDNKIAGYGLIAKTYSQEAGGIVVWIEEIYVKEAFRNKGIGSEFIEYVKNNIPAKRYRLETEPDNIKAQELYRRHGFKNLEYVNYSLET